ncbi:nucleoside monophosphate kinase [Saccharopolyspora sp. NPDC000995]
MSRDRREARRCARLHRDIFRRNINDGTPLGLKAKSYIDSSLLIPDSITTNTVRSRLTEHDAAPGFLVDGFPRTSAQATCLADILSEPGTPLDVVVELRVDERELVRRLTGRRTCRDCGRSCHLVFTPPAKADTCDACGGALYQARRRHGGRDSPAVSRLRGAERAADRVLPRLGC